MSDKDFLQLVRDGLVYRPGDAHKGTMGTMLSISGSYSMAGACILSSMAALRSGIGLLKVVLPQSIYPIVASSVHEAVFVPVKDGASGTVTADALDIVVDEAMNSTAALIGCGLKNTSDTREVVYGFINDSQCPLVIDADGINAVSENIDILKQSDRPVILTPHVKEMARLCKKNTEYICKNLKQVAIDFARRYNVIVVLKGSNIIITDGDNTVVRPTGNSGMAKGGSGDVLAGIITSILAQGTDAFYAALAGVCIHRLSGDIAADKYTKYAMIPSDMVQCIPDAFRILSE